MLPEISLSVMGAQIHIHTYDLFVWLSMTAGLAMAYVQLIRMGTGRIAAALTCAVTCASFLLGARVLNYVINYKKYTEAGIPLFIMKSGYFSLYGGMAASFLALYISSYRLKADFLELMDRLTVPFLLSYFVMKIGCFLNGCCYGKMTKSSFSVPLPLKEQAELAAIPLISQFFGSPEIRVYPAQLMEASAAILIIAAVLLAERLFRSKIKGNTKGAGFALSAALLSLFRLIILQFRSTSYSYTVLNIFYPMRYISVIAVSAAFLCSRLCLRNSDFLSHGYEDHSADSH